MGKNKRNFEGTRIDPQSPTPVSIYEFYNPKHPMPGFMYDIAQKMHVCPSSHHVEREMADLRARGYIIATIEVVMKGAIAIAAIDASVKYVHWKAEQDGQDLLRRMGFDVDASA